MLISLKSELSRHPLYFSARRLYRGTRARLGAGPRMPEEYARTRAIFIHVPKSAGNAITHSLFGRPSVDLIGHTRAIDLRRAHPRLYDESFSFTFVRHPVSRFVSAFNFLRAGGITPADAQWARTFLDGCAGIEDFVARLHRPVFRAGVMSYVHFIPQHRMICDAEDRIIVDFVGRYETLAADFEAVRHRVGFGLALREVNTTSEGPRQDAGLSAAGASAVHRLYRDDFRLLGYALDPAAGRAPR